MIDTPFVLFIGSDKLLPLIPARAMFSVTVRTVAEARKTWDQCPTLIPQLSCSFQQYPFNSSDPYFATLENEVIVWIDHEQRSELFVACHFHHGFFLTIVCRRHPMPLASTTYL
jgi:hypothetical protein